MSGALRELFGFFDFQVDPKGFNQANKQLDSVAKKAESIGKIIAGAFAVSAVESFFSSSIELGSRINDTANKLGVGTDELQQFQYAAKLSGVNSEEAAMSLGHLNRSIGEALGGNAAAAQSFSEVGIAIKDATGKTRPALDVLTDLADHFQATDDPAKKTALAMSILGRSGTALIPVLNQGGAELRRLFGQAGEVGAVLRKDFLEAADKAGDQIDIFKFSLEGLKSRIVLAFLPAITDAVAKGTEWAASLSDVVDKSNLAEAALIVLAGIGTYLAVTWALANIEFILTALALLAIWLVVDDILTLFDGGDSVIGDFLDSFYGAGTAAELVRELKVTWAQLGNEISRLGPTFQKLSQDLEKLGISLDGLGDKESVFARIQLRLQLLVLVVSTLVDVLDTLLSVIDAVVAGWNALPGVIKAGGDIGQRSADASRNNGGLTTAIGSIVQPLADVTLGSGGNQTIQQKNETLINIDGAADPIAVGRSVADKLSDTLLGDHRKALAAVK